MPIYEYRCVNCRFDFELLVRGAEQAECPQCQSVKLERKLSVVAAPGASASPAPSFSPGTCGRPQCGMNGCQGLG